jgi:hypothetical protein
MSMEIVIPEESGFCCALDRDSIQGMTAREESIG